MKQVTITGYLSESSKVIRYISELGKDSREFYSLKGLKEYYGLTDLKVSDKKEWAISNRGKKYEWFVYTAIMPGTEEAPPPTQGEILEGFTEGQIFLDKGDFDRTGEADELYIRGRINDETFDICNFGCNDTGFSKDYAMALVSSYNQAPTLYRENKELRESLDSWESIGKRVKFMFGNEANYPEGSQGYYIAKQIEELLNRK